jgi:hypothetical protein
MKMSWILNAWLIAAFLLTSCASGWTDEEKAAFTQSCEQSASQAGDAWPTQTCGCITAKLEQQYPNPNNMEALLDSLKANPILLFDKFPECRVPANQTPVVWTPEAEMSFLTSCTQAAEKGFVPNAKDCPCVLEKAKKRFPTEQMMERLTVETMKALSEECAGTRAPMLY